MFAKLILIITCLFTPSSQACKPLPALPPVSLNVAPTPVLEEESFQLLQSLTLRPGKNSFRILFSNPVLSDGFQLHFSLQADLSNLSLSKTPVPGLNTLTARASGNQLWLAAITSNPALPWSSDQPVGVADFSFTSPTADNLEILLGSTSLATQHKSPSVNLLQTGSAKITIESIN